MSRRTGERRVGPPLRQRKGLYWFSCSPRQAWLGEAAVVAASGLVGSWMDHDIWFSLPDHRAGQDGGLGLFNGGLARSARRVTLRLCSDEWLQLVV